MVTFSESRLSLVLLMIAILTSCSGNNKSVNREGQAAPAAAVQMIPPVGNETSLLLKYLAENGGYVNSQEYPSLIKASIVHEELGSNILVIDIRSSSSFSKGHIRGAVNKKFSELPEYFQTGIKPFEYDKIIMVCDDGQLSSYTTCLLRLMGYGNVYAMRWGMSAWNKVFAETGWLKGLSSQYESALDTATVAKPAPSGMPDLATGKSTGEEICTAQFGKIFKDGTDGIMITAQEVFADPSQYFVINLERKDKYEDGHIPGAVRYKPESTLSYIPEMSTIPKGKTVVIYCGTGHNSAFASAYLRFFGYDARTLKYGNNSFMYNKMGRERVSLSWLPFTLADVNDFETAR